MHELIFSITRITENKNSSGVFELVTCILMWSGKEFIKNKQKIFDCF